MDFAKKQLLKYGWTEGKGLGKNEDGISEALKPKLKFDTTGVGHDSSEQFTFNWWENVYNNAAENININAENDKISIDVKNESVNITTKKYSISVANKTAGLEYGRFLKTSKLTPQGIVDHELKSGEPTQEIVKVQILTDAELFKACGGRTAHKAARHGLKLTGKEARLARQEKELQEIKQLETDCKKVVKKIKSIKKQLQEKKHINNTVIPNLPDLAKQFTVSEINNPQSTDHSNSENEDKEKVLVAIVAKSIKKKKKNKKMEEDHENEKTDENIKNIKKTNKKTNIDNSNANIGEMGDENVERKCKKKRKRKSHVPTEEEIELEATKKRYEEFCENKSRKKLTIKKRREAKQFDKIAEMFDNVNLDKEPVSEDDGFEEGVCTKKIKITKSTNKSEKKTKKKKCKKKYQPENFDDLMIEIKDKLCHAVELRKELNQKKKNSDNQRIEKMSEELNKCNFN